MSQEKSKRGSKAVFLIENNVLFFLVVLPIGYSFEPVFHKVQFRAITLSSVYQ